MLPIVTYHDMKTGQPPKAHKSRSIYSHIENLETRTKLGYRHVQLTGVYTQAWSGLDSCSLFSSFATGSRGSWSHLFEYCYLSS